MKKYIVKVKYADSNHIDIITLKAKNNLDLEYKVAKELKSIFDTLQDVNSIEYEQVKRFTFKKKDYTFFVGTTYVGGQLLEGLLKQKEE